MTTLFVFAVLFVEALIVLFILAIVYLMWSDLGSGGRLPKSLRREARNRSSGNANP